MFPWLPDLGWALAAFGLVILMVYLLRPGGSSDFVITVDDEDVDFRGDIPQHARPDLREFFLNDIPVGEEYIVRGKWDGRVLSITVTGPARPYEQRIRNFLKLQLKPPLRKESPPV